MEILSILQQQVTPDTTNYMIAGYTVILSGILLYLLSLVIRKRNLERDLLMLHEIEQKEEGKEERVYNP
jgi:hypothetical protein